MKQKQLSRKQLRKQRRQQKKQRIQKHHLSKQHNPQPQLQNAQASASKSKSITKHNNANLPKSKNTQSKQVTSQQTKVQNKKIKRIPQQFGMEDEEIARFEQKLGIKGNNDKKYGKMAKRLGFDDDLFDFLDGISKKVKGNNNDKYEQQYEEAEDQDEQQDMEGAGDDDEDQGHDDFEDVSEQVGEFGEDQLEDMLNQQQLDKYLMEAEDQIIKPKKKRKQQVQKQSKQSLKQKQAKNKKESKSQPNSNSQLSKQPPFSLTPSSPQQQCQKRMNSLFNKLSDGNLLYTFRQFISIFQSHPKSLTYQLFSTLFIKFNLMIEKPLIHVMSSNIVIAASLHRVYGDRFMAKLVYMLTQEFEKLYMMQEDQEEIQEIGYSRVFQKKKNFITIVSYLYEFGSISAQFPQTLVYHLTNNIADKENIQLIYQIVQKCGVRMRNHDPGALKQVIQVLKKMIQDSKINGTYETTKIKFIDLQINQIRFNKKTLFDADQKMGFLKTFLEKTIKSEMPAQQSTIDVSYDLMKHVQDTNGPQWWLGESKNTNNVEEETKKGVKVQQLSQQVKRLYELAKSMHFVTQIKKNIFVELMSSQDYIEATKKVLELKVKRLEDLASVLVEVNIQETSYNPFYSLVACKIAEQIPKFRVCLQFAVWDRLKQINTFDARKISNLAKFTAWFVASEVANSSLTILKYFPDLLNIKSEEDIFLRVFFKELFKKSSKNWIARLSNKLKQQKNKGIRDGIKDYLGQTYETIETQKQKNNCTLLRKLLTAQFEDQLDDQ